MESTVVSPAPDFADNLPELPTSPPPSLQQPLSPVLEMLQNYETTKDEEQQHWDSVPVDNVALTEGNAGNFIESDAHAYGVRARALYDYVAGELVTKYLAL